MVNIEISTPREEVDTRENPSQARESFELRKLLEFMDKRKLNPFECLIKREDMGLIRKGIGDEGLLFYTTRYQVKPIEPGFHHAPELIDMMHYSAGNESPLISTEVGAL